MRPDDSASLALLCIGLQALFSKHTAAELKQILHQRRVEYASDKLIVKWRDPKRSHSSSAQAAAQSQRVGLLSSLGLRAVRTSAVSGVQVFGLSSKQDVVDRVMQLQQQPELVEYAEPDYVVHATDLAQHIPNDPYFSSLWYATHSLG